MERTRKIETPTPAPAEEVEAAPVDKRIWWKKVGGGSFRFNGKIIKPGEKFKAEASQIPSGFKDLIIPLQDIPADIPTPLPPVNVKPLAYTKVKRGKGGAWFNVIDGDGKVLNEKALTSEAADKLLADLAK